MPKKEEEILKAGEIINNRYEVIALIGSGGYGQVYRVKNSRGVTSALKIMKFNDEKNNILKNQEAVFSAKANSNINTVKTWDYGEYLKDGINYGYIVMQEYKNSSLDKIPSDIDFKYMTNEELKYFIPKVVDALRSLHNSSVEKGILHRDIKPQNILIGDLRSPVITDFGISMNIDENPRLLSFAGTPKYLAPEMSMLNEDNLIYISTKNPRYDLDIYALGVILYELSTGQTMYPDYIPKKNPGMKLEKEAQEKVKKPFQTEYINPSEFNKNIDKNLEYIINKMVAKDDNKRYRNFSEVDDDILIWVNGKDIKNKTLNVNEVTSKNKLKKFFTSTFDARVNKFSKLFNKFTIAFIGIFIGLLVFIFLLVVLLT